MSGKRNGSLRFSSGPGGEPTKRDGIRSLRIPNAEVRPSPTGVKQKGNQTEWRNYQRKDDSSQCERFHAESSCREVLKKVFSHSLFKVSEDSPGVRPKRDISFDLVRVNK